MPNTSLDGKRYGIGKLDPGNNEIAYYLKSFDTLDGKISVVFNRLEAKSWKTSGGAKNWLDLHAGYLPADYVVVEL